MWTNALHVIEVIAAYFCAHGLGVRAYKRGEPWWKAFGIALLPGFVLALATWQAAPGSEKLRAAPEGFAIWITYASLGTVRGYCHKRKSALTTPNPSGIPPE